MESRCTALSVIHHARVTCHTRSDFDIPMDRQSVCHLGSSVCVTHRQYEACHGLLPVSPRRANPSMNRWTDMSRRRSRVHEKIIAAQFYMATSTSEGQASFRAYRTYWHMPIEAHSCRSSIAGNHSFHEYTDAMTMQSVV